MSFKAHYKFYYSPRKSVKSTIIQIFFLIKLISIEISRGHWVYYWGLPPCAIDATALLYIDVVCRYYWSLNIFNSNKLKIFYVAVVRRSLESWQLQPIFRWNCADHLSPEKTSACVGDSLTPPGPTRGSGGGAEAKYFQNFNIWKQIVANLI